MPRLLLPLATALAAGCFSPTTDLALSEFDGWETPDVIVKVDAPSSAAIAVAPAPQAVPVQRARPTKQVKSRFTSGGGAGAMSSDIDMSGALTAAPSAAGPTQRRATTQRAAVSAPKLEQAKGGAVSLTRSAAPQSSGSSSSLSIGTSVRRGLSADQVRGVALASMGQVRACYERALKTAPNLQGRIVVDWKVAPSGAVSRASIKSDDIGDSELQGCVIETVKSWTFPESGRSTPVSFPFTLRPG